MVKTILSCLILGLASIAVTLAANAKDVPSSIVWEKNLEDVIVKAKAAGKSILLDFFAPT
ncbi:MAG: hypothetical protein NG747_12480 [Candidatus Brocadia sp.]|nr:hypothetical protein [Candidatus Brocadia sp.]NUO08454.1 hypothetical protein [Candidatus Brocadia sp.]